MSAYPIMPSPVRYFTGLAGFLALAIAAPAAKNNLPDRDTPVPADQPIPVVDFARPSLFDDAKLNPAGTYFAAFSKNEKLERSVMICELATGKVQWTDSGVWTFAWVDDHHIQLNERPGQVVAIDRPLRQLDITSLLPELKRGLIQDTGFLWKWPLPESPTNNGRVTRTWQNLEDGQAVFCTTSEDDGHKRLYRRDAGRWVECPVNLDEITPVEVGDQPGEMLVIGPPAKGSPRALQRLEAATGHLGEVLYRDAEYDCQPDVFLKRGTHKVIGVSVPGKAARMVWFEPRLREVQGMIDRQFPGLIAEIVSSNLTENRFLIRTESDRQQPTFHLLDYDKKSLSLVKNVTPWLAPERMARMQIMSYRARDGATLEAYLTLPAGASRDHPAPLVVDIHGGPWNHRNLWGEDNGAQFFASRGYATLQVNYRGSSGYDARFEPSDRFDFQKMINDVADGVQAAAKSGLVDPHRVAALGTGFGAYLALCGTVDNPELYRCAILFGGTFDWERQFRKMDSPTRRDEAWLQRRLQEEKHAAPAPLQHKDRIRIPLFFARNIQVADVTFDTQVFDLYLALKGQVPCESFGDLNIRASSEVYDEVVQRLNAMDAFLAKNLAPLPAGSSATAGKK